MVKRTWVCSTCSLVFARKWNLDRHIKLIHGPSPKLAENKVTHVQGKNKSGFTNFVPDFHQPFNPDEEFSRISEFAKFRNTIANSNKIFEPLNFLQLQLSSLQQQVRYYEKQITDCLSYNWILSKYDIQGISGYVCKRCSTFSLKPIIDLGYDMTMKAKHRCGEGIDKTNYIVHPIPSHIENIDEWAANVLLNHVNLYIPIGKYLAVHDLSAAFNILSNKLNYQAATETIGIPDRYSLCSLEKDYRIDWVYRAIANLGKKIEVDDSEKLDFFRRVKSTFGVFQIPIGDTWRWVLMNFTT